MRSLFPFGAYCSTLLACFFCYFPLSGGVEQAMPATPSCRLRSRHRIMASSSQPARRRSRHPSTFWPCRPKGASSKGQALRCTAIALLCLFCHPKKAPKLKHKEGLFFQGRRYQRCFAFFKALFFSRAFKIFDLVALTAKGVRASARDTCSQFYS